jgi:glycosidase
VREPQNYFKTTEGHIIAHGRDPYFAGWSDTAQINYAQPAGREAMAEKLRAIAAQCDGVRCDMAMLILPDIMQRVWGERLGKNPVLLSFWKEIIDEFSRAYPNFLFIAETYWDLEWKLQQEGFHFTYDKTLYDRLCKNDFAGVKSHLQADINFQNRSARFIENHDEPRAAEEFGPARSRSHAARRSPHSSFRDCGYFTKASLKATTSAFPSSLAGARLRAKILRPLSFTKNFSPRCAIRFSRTVFFLS